MIDRSQVRMTFGIRDLFFFVGFVAVAAFAFSQIDLISGFLFSAGGVARFISKVLVRRRSLKLASLGLYGILIWFAFFNIWFVERWVDTAPDKIVKEFELERQIRICGFVVSRKVCSKYRGVVNHDAEVTVLRVYYGGFVPMDKIRSGTRMIVVD